MGKFLGARSQKSPFNATLLRGTRELCRNKVVWLKPLSFVSAGEPGSHVFGSVSDGVFHGKIVSARDGAWYVERSHYYFPGEGFNASRHSVIYHEDDVEDPYKHLRTGTFSNFLNVKDAY